MAPAHSEEPEQSQRRGAPSRHPEVEHGLAELVRVMDNAAQALFVSRVADMRFTYVNNAACELTGYDEAELLDLEPQHLDTRGRESGGVAWHTEHAASTRTTVVRRKDGVDIPVEITSGVPSSSPGGDPQVMFLVADITQRLRDQESITRSAEELRIAEERDRIARDLHDTVIQRLFAAGMDLQVTARAVVDNDDGIETRIENAIDEIDASIADIRAAISTTLSASAAPPDLSAAICAIVDESAATLGFAPIVEIAIDEDNPPPAVIVDQALPTLREALSNVIRHAAASEVVVTVTCDGRDYFEMSITDDGIGFASGDKSRSRIRGRGIANMSARAAGLGGTCSIERAGSCGTTIVWQAPLKRRWS